MEWSADRARKDLLDAPDVKATFVIEENGTLLATASARYFDERFPGVGYVHWVAVDPAARGRGLFDVVMAAVENRVRRRRPSRRISRDRRRAAARDRRLSPPRLHPAIHRERPRGPLVENLHAAGRGPQRKTLMAKSEQLKIGIVGVPRGRGQMSAIDAAGPRVRLAGLLRPQPQGDGNLRRGQRRDQAVRKVRGRRRRLRSPDHRLASAVPRAPGRLRAEPRRPRPERSPRRRQHGAGQRASRRGPRVIGAVHDRRELLLLARKPHGRRDGQSRPLRRPLFRRSRIRPRDEGLPDQSRGQPDLAPLLAGRQERRHLPHPLPRPAAAVDGRPHRLPELRRHRPLDQARSTTSRTPSSSRPGCAKAASSACGSTSSRTART